LQTLHSWENQSLWRNLRVDNGGDWILNSLVAGALDIVHDGSYMKKVSPKVCSMALWMRCRLTQQSLKCSWVELSNSADNYRGELLGAVCCSLILKAAASAPAAYPRQPLERYCDNMGVVKHGNRLYSTLRDKQAQADLIRLIRSLDEALPFKCRYVWVESHTDSKYKRRRAISEKEAMNQVVDVDAKAALVDGILTNQFILSRFPFETIRIYAGAKKLTGPLRPFITSHHSKKVARKVYGWDPDRGKKLVSEEDFDLVFWEIIPRALKEFPSSFKDWLSKHVTGCCGVNRFLSKWDPKVQNICPCCGRFNEDIMHITTCRNEGRTVIFNDMVTDMEYWMEDNYTPPALVYYIGQYLRARSTKLMSQIVSPRSRWFPFAQIHDRLGWRCFVEGRISTILVHEMHAHLSSTPSRIGAADWAKGLVNHLFRLTHRQWSYRNQVVHHTVEGRTVEEHQEVIREIEELLSVDPKTLMPKYRSLFEDQDFEELGRGSTANRLYWLYSARAAVAASAIERRRKRKRRNRLLQQRAQQQSTDAPSAPQAAAPAPEMPCELGFRYKKRRLK
jgi:hypothetical protein